MMEGEADSKAFASRFGIRKGEKTDFVETLVRVPMRICV